MEPSVAPPPVTTTLPQGRIIETIIYTSGLSSNVAAVDPLLDTVRLITSRQLNSDPRTFSPEDIASLHSLQQQLEDYLVHKEPLRSFDYETLHLHIAEHITKGSSNATLILLVVAIVGAGFAAGGLSLLLPLDISGQVHSFLFVTMAYSVAYLGTAGLFLGAIRKLTAEARRAYMYICISTVIVSVAAQIQPLVSILQLEDKPVMPTVIIAPFVGAYFMLYKGVSIFGRLAGVQGLLLTKRLLLTLWGIVTVAALIIPPLILPYTSNNLPLGYVISVVFFQGLSMVMLGIAAAVLQRAYRRLTYHYVRATRLLFYAIGSLALLNVYLMGYWTLVGSLHPNSWLNVAAIGAILSVILYLRAGYTFNKMHRS